MKLENKPRIDELCNSIARIKKEVASIQKYMDDNRPNVVICLSVNWSETHRANALPRFNAESLVKEQIQVYELEIEMLTRELETL